MQRRNSSQSSTKGKQEQPKQRPMLHTRMKQAELKKKEEEEKREKTGIPSAEPEKQELKEKQDLKEKQELKKKKDRVKGAY